ncbi:unnamed protein product [Peronospora farinosa]|uniref:Uncharacterized protein n=1 Tax=Peronospora farinosa TaxID=134698 RepID=A0AAV0TBP4_9STRA|nr:unnamed protein product [Peronospora farinosa]
MEAIQQDMEPFWTEMNALRSVISTTDVDPACRGACKKALEANACGLIQAELARMSKNREELQSVEALYQRQKELQSMQKKELKKQKNNLGKKCRKMKS